MKRTFSTSLLAVTLILASLSTAATAFGQDPKTNDKDTACQTAGRERQQKEIDHATGKASEKEMNDARAKEAKACEKNN